MSESKLYNKLKNNWSGYIKRIEPKDISLGIPDVHLVNSHRRDVFVELKFLEKEFKNKILPIKKSQFIWHETYPGSLGFMLFNVSSIFYLFHSSQVKYLRGKIKFEDFKNCTVIYTDDFEKIIALFNKSI